MCVFFVLARATGVHVSVLVRRLSVLGIQICSSHEPVPAVRWHTECFGCLNPHMLHNLWHKYGEKICSLALRGGAPCEWVVMCCHYVACRKSCALRCFGAPPGLACHWGAGDAARARLGGSDLYKICMLAILYPCTPGTCVFYLPGLLASSAEHCHKPVRFYATCFGCCAAVHSLDVTRREHRPFNVQPQL